MDSALDSGAADLDVDVEGVEFDVEGVGLLDDLDVEGVELLYAADLDADVEGVELRQMVEQSGKQTHGR